MKLAFTVLSLLVATALLPAQSTFQEPEDFGCFHIPFEFEEDTVDILIRPNQEDYDKKKPLLLFVQGSMPKPLLRYDESGRFGTFPFDANIFVKDYHLAIISKPSIPLICHEDELEQPHSMYKDPQTGEFPKKYCQNNHLDYYVNRNKAVLDFLSKKEWIDENKIVVVGHSEGVSIAFKMALEKAKMTHLVLLNGNLATRMMSIIINNREVEQNKEDYLKTEKLFHYWQSLVATNPLDLSDDCSKSDSNKATASFSFPYRQYISDIDIPVFVGYGTKDKSVGSSCTKG